MTNRSGSLFVGLRRWVQTISITLFILLFFQTRLDLTDFTSAISLKNNMKPFFAIDPLLLITTLLAEHTVPMIFLLSGITLLITFIFGRFFCGWICPFGVLHHIMSWIGDRLHIPKNASDTYHPGQQIKYYLLTALLVTSVFGINLAGWVDPISLLTRSMTSFIIPLMQTTINGIGTIFRWLHLESTANMLEIGFVESILGAEQIYIGQAFFIGVIFVSLLATNLFIRRFWCRFLCPLGALLGVVSGTSLFRIQQASGCTHCHKCAPACGGAADPQKAKAFKVSECMMLGNCLTACPENVLSYNKIKPFRITAPIDINRRRLTGAAVSGIFAAPLIRLDLHPTRSHPLLVRPPGALSETDFLATCVRCDACIRCCPENFLQPALLEGRLEGLWTPIGNGDIGYCEFNCNICGTVCPTGAIQPLPLEQKQQVAIGTAFIDPSRCLPYAFDKQCIVCEEHCPTAPKAIKFRKEIRITPDGNEIELKLPVIIPEDCIGCAICQNKCPVMDKPAIIVTSVGETRSETNQMILKNTGYGSGDYGS